MHSIVNAIDYKDVKNLKWSVYFYFLEKILYYYVYFDLFLNFSVNNPKIFVITFSATFQFIYF